MDSALYRRNNLNLPDAKGRTRGAGPDGLLFVGDAKGASVIAIETGDSQPGTLDELLTALKIGTHPISA